MSTDGRAAFAPLRIAMLVLYLPSESKMGVGWTVHRLANELVARGHSVTVYSPCTRPADAQYDHVHVPLTGRNRSFKWGWRIGKIDFSGYDVLHAHGDDHFVRRSRRPRAHVRTMHGSCFDEAFHIRGVRERIRMVLLGMTEAVSAVRTRTVVGVSKHSIRFYPWRRCVIPNGVDLARFAPSGAREPEPTILFVGTYRGRKRGALLMDAFEREVLPQMPTAQLWMVCSDAPSAANVSVLGRLDEQALAACYRRAWVFCLPSSYEGFGIPYVEAMAAGLRVLATPNPGARELLSGVDGCTIVDDADLGAALTDALRCDPACDPMRAQRYSWEEVTTAYEAVYAR